MKTPKGNLSYLVQPGARFNVRVTPRASRNELTHRAGQLRAFVTTVPENGKATQDVIALLAHALGVPKSRVTLIRGQTSRNKVFALN